MCSGYFQEHGRGGRAPKDSCNTEEPWRLQKAASLELPVQVAGNLTEECPFPLPLLTVHVNAGRDPNPVTFRTRACWFSITAWVLWASLLPTRMFQRGGNCCTIRDQTRLASSPSSSWGWEWGSGSVVGYLYSVGRCMAVVGVVKGWMANS